MKTSRRSGQFWLADPPPSGRLAIHLKNITGSTTGEITKLDTTSLANGAYWLELDATDSTGHTMGSGIWVLS